MYLLREIALGGSGWSTLGDSTGHSTRPMPDDKCREGGGLHWMPDVNGDCWSVVDDGCSILDVNTWKMSSSLTLAWDLIFEGLWQDLRHLLTSNI